MKYKRRRVMRRFSKPLLKSLKSPSQVRVVDNELSELLLIPSSL